MNEDAATCQEPPAQMRGEDFIEFLRNAGEAAWTDDPFFGSIYVDLVRYGQVVLCFPPLMSTDDVQAQAREILGGVAAWGQHFHVTPKVKLQTKDIVYRGKPVSVEGKILLLLSVAVDP